MGRGELVLREITENIRHLGRNATQHGQLFGEIALRFRDTRETIAGWARIGGAPQDRL
jgi:hypothetical protein